MTTTHARGALRGAGVLACPRDAAALDRVTVDGVALDKCPSCRGTWFDATELRRVAHDKELEKLASHVGKYPAQSGFPCPRCGGSCVAAFVGDVEVDTCAACHGVWLDAGELDEAKRQVEIRRAMAAAGPGFRDFLRRL